MKQIRWTTGASEQLETAVERIQQDNPTAARRFAHAMIARVEELASFPALGRPGEVAGTRELVRPPYVIVYRVTDEVVEILHVWHGAQDWR